MARQQTAKAMSAGLAALTLLTCIAFLRTTSTGDMTNPSAQLQVLRAEVPSLRNVETLARMELEEVRLIDGKARTGVYEGVGPWSVSHGGDSRPPAKAVVEPSVPVSPPLPPPPSPSTPSSPPPPVSSPSLSQEVNYQSYLADKPDDPGRPQVSVVLYNKFEGFLDWWREEEFIRPARSKCSTECTFTKDKSKLSSADVVLFHVKTHQPPTFPNRAHPKQNFGMVSLEQPGYAPKMNDKNYVAKFDYTLTYDLDSTVPTITVSPHHTAQEYHDAPVLPFAEKDGFGEPTAIAAFVSNCRAAGAEERLKMMEELSKHMPVHSYGSCNHNKDEPSMPGAKSKAENKQMVLRRYKFYLSFENSIVKDYVSEKVFDGLLGGTLPVYRGAESIDKFMPSSTSPCVVKMSDFVSMKELADFLLQLAEDEHKYNEYFKWKEEEAVGRFQGILDMTAYKYTSMCRLCEYAHLHRDD